MIKKVIFDLDDTLIINKENGMSNYDRIVKKYKLDSSVQELYDVIGMYEHLTKKYDRYELLDLINKHYNTNYSVDIVDDIIDAVGEWTYVAPQKVKDTLKYLSSKYELYVLTNWFTKSQVQRLKTAGLYGYFKDVISAEVCAKPNEEAFSQFYKDCLPEECIIVGDNYKMDIEVPEKLGIKTIMCNFKNKTINYDGKVITDFKELVDVL